MKQFSWIFSALFLLGLNAVIVWNALFNQQDISRDAGLKKQQVVAAQKESPDKTPIKPKRDELVYKVQQHLAKQGIYKDIPDGVYGMQTRKSIAEYQRIAGLTVDGKPSEYLLNHMFISSHSLGKKVAHQKPVKRVVVGSSGLSNPVKRAQIGLDELGYNPGLADGLLGAQTRQAIREFEKDNKLDVTGTVTEVLLKKLEEVTGTSRLNPT